MNDAVSRMRGAMVVIGKIIAGSASTSQMLAMLEPMMLPCARPVLPAAARLDADQEFRHRRAEADDQDADEQRRDVRLVGGGERAAHEAVARIDQDRRNR